MYAGLPADVPAFNPAFTVANDWLHTNAIQGTADGNIIISERSQDWVLKINYANGKGDGSVIWHLGAGGDFTIVNPPSTDLQRHHHSRQSQHHPLVHPSARPVVPIPGGRQRRRFQDSDHLRRRKHPRDASAPRLKTAAAWFSWSMRRRGRSTSRRRPTWADTPLALGAAQLLTPPSGNIYASFDNGILPGH